MSEPEIALLVTRAEEVVTAQQLFVQRRGRTFDRQPPAAVSSLLALLELLEVHRVVDIGDEDAIRVRDERSAGDHPSLEHEHVAPLDELAKLGCRPGAGAEALARSIGSHDAEELDVMFAG